MTTANVEDQQHQQQQEQEDQANLNAAPTAEDDAQADAEFEAAFNAARGDDVSHAGKTTEQDNADADKDEDGNANNGEGGTSGETDADAQAAAAAAAEEEARKQAEADAAAKAAPVTVTKEQFDNLLAAAAKVSELETKLAQTSDKAFGRIGSLQQTIADLKKSATTGKPLSAVQLKRLSAEFPEMASLLAEDLKESSAESEAPAGNGQANALDADAIREQTRQEVAIEYEQQLITARHNDWKDVVNSSEFQQWTAGLRPEAQQLLATTSSSQVFGDAIDAFKSFRAAQAEQAAAAAAAANNAHKQRDKRLDAAVTPNGVPASGSVVDEDEAFLAGFKSARGNR